MTRPAARTTANSQTQVDDHDPDRPVMKRPVAGAVVSASSDSSAGSTAITPAAAASNDNDPNRPVLSRTKTPKQKPQATSDFPAEKPGAPPAMSAKGARSYPAISDAGHYRGAFAAVLHVSGRTPDAGAASAEAGAWTKSAPSPPNTTARRSPRRRPSPTTTCAPLTWITAARPRWC